MTFITGKPFSLNLFFLYDGLDKELIGQKATISDLEKLFGEKIVLMKDNPFPVFGIQKKKDKRYLAYECDKCEGLIIGPPEKQHFNTFQDEHLALSDSIKYHYNCERCGEHLGSDYEVIS